MVTRLLLIEDEPLLCDLLADYVETLPEIEFLGDAREPVTALAKARTLQPDLAIVDIRLPGTTGLSLLEFFKEELPDTKVIIFTGTIDEATLRQALEKGANAYIEKAYGLTELSKGIKAVLRGETYYSPGIARLVEAFQVN